jgi:hypothetical protein
VEGDAVVYSPDVSEEDAVATYLLGGEASNAVDETAELARFLYGSKGTTTLVTTDAIDNTVGGSAKYLLGGDSANAIDFTAQLAGFLFGGEGEAPSVTAEEEVVIFNPDADAVADTTSYIYGGNASCAPAAENTGAAANPYEVDGKCTSDECIAFVIRKMQGELGISDADLDEGLAWGDDMVQYCQWQARQETSPSKLAAPPLPFDYAKPPAPSVCKTVMASSRLLVHTSSL